MRWPQFSINVSVDELVTCPGWIPDCWDSSTPMSLIRNKRLLTGGVCVCVCVCRRGGGLQKGDSVKCFHAG